MYRWFSRDAKEAAGTGVEEGEGGGGWKTKSATGSLNATREVVWVALRGDGRSGISWSNDV